AEAIQSIMLIKLRKALLQLSKMELQLIDALYFQSKSERTYSVETGIPRMTISNRKNRIIEKLKKLLEK
ncbi:MAG: sigma-70 family RNA polymerase sigma factor, partial [Oscillospiraceae bacterium]